MSDAYAARFTGDVATDHDHVISSQPRRTSSVVVSTWVTVWIASAEPAPGAQRHEPGDPSDMIADAIRIAEDRRRANPSAAAHLHHLLCLDHAALGQIVTADIAHRLLELAVSGPSVRVFPVLGRLDAQAGTLPLASDGLSYVIRAVRALHAGRPDDLPYLTPMLADAALEVVRTIQASWEPAVADTAIAVLRDRTAG